MDLQALIVTTLSSALNMSFTLLVPSLGEAISERSGVYNVGVEGYMLIGALSGYYGMVFTGDLWIGLLAGILGGCLLSLIHAYFSITLRCSQIICGMGIWFFSMGFSAYIFRMWHIESPIKGFSPIHIKVLSELPIVGEMLFQQNVLVYLGFLLTFIFAVILFWTPFGLVVRGVGDNPLAVDMAGHNVFLIRYISVLTCGGMSGLGGAYLSLAVLHRFSENMTAGRGFIALCIVIFGNWNPVRILLGSLIFAGVDAFQLRMQALGANIPYPFLLMLPYVLTLVVLVGFAGKVAAPRKLIIPYIKGEE